MSRNVSTFFEQRPAQGQPDAVTDLGADLIGARRNASVGSEVAGK